MKIHEAIVLAGGLGTRLQSEVSDIPKPMAPIGNRPFLEFILANLSKSGIKKVILATGYLSEKIKTHFSNEFYGMEIAYSIEDEPMGTGGALKLAAIQTSQSHVLILNGDTFFNIDYTSLCDFHFQKNATLSVALRQISDSSRYGQVICDSHNKIIGFEEKNIGGSALINAGTYVLNLNLLTTIKRKKFSFEKNILETASQNQTFFGMPFDEYFIDIGIPEDYRRAQQSLFKLKVF